MKYVVILESDTGYMDCIAICDNADEAYGAAYLALSDGVEDDDKYYLTLPDYREGNNGFVMEIREKEDDKVLYWATVLFYKPGEGEKADDKGQSRIPEVQS